MESHRYEYRPYSRREARGSGSQGVIQDIAFTSRVVCELGYPVYRSTARNLASTGGSRSCGIASREHSALRNANPASFPGGGDGDGVEAFTEPLNSDVSKGELEARVVVRSRFKQLVQSSRAVVAGVPRAKLCEGYVANTPASTLDATYQRMPPRLAVVHVENELPQRRAKCTRAEVGVESSSKRFRTVLTAPTRTAVVGTDVATESAAVARLVAGSSRNRQ